MTVQHGVYEIRVAHLQCVLVMHWSHEDLVVATVEAISRLQSKVAIFLRLCRKANIGVLGFARTISSIEHTFENFPFEIWRTPLNVRLMLGRRRAEC